MVLLSPDSCKEAVKVAMTVLILYKDGWQLLNILMAFLERYCSFLNFSHRNGMVKGIRNGLYVRLISCGNTFRNAAQERPTEGEQQLAVTEEETK